MTDVIITCLLNATPDPQRGTTLPADWALLGGLVDSLDGHRLKVISDCLDGPPPPDVDLCKVEPDKTSNVYFLRWRHIAAHLDAAQWIDRVWCVDGTDVQLLRDPFAHLARGVLHIGSEPSTIGSPWMRATNPACGTWIEKHANHVLLNPGLVGGDRAVVAEFARRVAAMEGRDMSDMGAANVVAHQMGYLTGSAIHTTYKAYADNGVARFQHK